MTDTIEQGETTESINTDVVETTEPAQAEEKPAKAPKVKPEPSLCACSQFEVGETDEVNEEDRTVFTTECDRKTLSTFAQGHDAKLVSFLVQAEFDKQNIWQSRDGVLVSYSGAAHALSSISEKLAEKADAALSRMTGADEVKKAKIADRNQAREAKAAEKAQAKQAREEAAAAKKAEKATKGPKDVPVKVVEGSEEGDEAVAGTIPPAPVDGEQSVTIKVGRWEYLATLSADGDTVTFTNNSGELQTRKTDEVRILSK